MTEKPPPSVILPSAAKLRFRDDQFLQPARLGLVQILGNDVGDMDALFAVEPIVAQLGHAFGVPERSRSAERLLAIAMHGFVQGNRAADIVAGDGVEMALGLEAIARRTDLGDGHARALADFGDALRLHLADDVFGPCGNILGHVSFENAGGRTAPVGGNQLGLGFQLFQQRRLPWPTSRCGVENAATKNRRRPPHGKPAASGRFAGPAPRTATTRIDAAIATVVRMFRMALVLCQSWFDAFRWGGSCTATPNPWPPGWQYNCHPNLSFDD